MQEDLYHNDSVYFFFFFCYYNKSSQKVVLSKLGNKKPGPSFVRLSLAEDEARRSSLALLLCTPASSLLPFLPLLLCLLPLVPSKCTKKVVKNFEKKFIKKCVLPLARSGFSWLAGKKPTRRERASFAAFTIQALHSWLLLKYRQAVSQSLVRSVGRTNILEELSLYVRRIPLCLVLIISQAPSPQHTV